MQLFRKGGRNGKKIFQCEYRPHVSTHPISCIRISGKIATIFVFLEYIALGLRLYQVETPVILSKLS